MTDPNFVIYGLEREFERVEDFVENIKSGIADFFFLNFFAPEGFAKSYLIRQTWKKYERILPVAFIKVKEYLNPDGEADCPTILIKILQDFDERLPRRVSQLPAGYENLRNENELAEILVNLVKNAKDAEKIFLFLFDDYDLLPGPISSQIETEVFSKLVEMSVTGIILTSKLELVFDNGFELRMRLEHYEVSNLDIEGISKSLPQYQGIASEIYMLTGGIVNLMSGLVQQLEQSQINSGNFHLHQNELTKKYYQDFIENTILKQYKPQVRDTLLVLALLRRFDSKVLTKILPEILPQYYSEDMPPGFYIELIKGLGDTVQWRAQGGYTVVPALRVALHGYVRFDIPEVFRKVNLTAVRVNRDFLTNGGYKEYYLLELIYHKIILSRDEKGLGLFPIQEKVGKELVEYLNGDSAALVPQNDLDLLRNWLKQDPDISIYINEEALKAIDRMIQVRDMENRALKEARKEQL